MAEKIFLPLVLGTGREGRESEKPARFLFTELQKKENIETEFIDVREFAPKHTIPPWADPTGETTRWREIVRRADGFILVVPEYNHGYPGELKLLLDMADKAEYSGKTIGLAGVSSGGFGGVRVIEQLQPILNYLQLFSVPSPLSISTVQKVFRGDGSLEDETYREKIIQFIDKMIAFTEKLRSETK